MGTNIIFGIVIAIIIIAAVLYAIGFFMRKKNQEKLNDLEKRKENLFDLLDIKFWIVSLFNQLFDISPLKINQFRDAI